MEKALQDGKSVSLANHTLLITKDGRKIVVDDSAAPIRGESGELAGAVLVFRDISRRRNAEKALEESEKRFRVVFARAPIGMLLTGIDGNYLHSNQAYCDITGYSAEELANVRFLSLTHPDQAVENPYAAR